MLAVRHVSFRSPTQSIDDDLYFLYAIVRKPGQTQVGLACIQNDAPIGFPVHQSFDCEDDAINFLRSREEHSGLVCLRYAWHELRPEHQETVDGFDVPDRHD